MATLPLNDKVNVIINLSARATVRKGFNLAMILGTSDVIPVEERVRVYGSLDSMVSDGFARTSPEYGAADIFFQQSTRPGKVAVGVWDPEEEELLDAVSHARAKNGEWYVLLPLTQETNDIFTLSSYVESARPSTAMVYVAPDEALPTTLNGLNRRRSLGIVSPQANLHAAIMGWAMGAQTGLVDSAYTLDSKTLVGVATDDWTENRVAGFRKIHANYYINRGDAYDLFEDGCMADGTWFDELINLDKLANDLQLSTMDLINHMRKVPQTDQGIEMLRNAMVDPLEVAKKIGFIAPGIWTGVEFMGLRTNDALPLGYLIQNEILASQSIADRENRIAPPFYIAVKLAGAVHSVVIQVDVNR